MWNTTEWANHTRTINVRNVVPPRLELGSESVNVTFEEGDANRRLSCDAVGDPKPTVKWDVTGISSVRVDGADGETLVFTRVSVVLHDRVIVTCAAKNQFSHTVRKSFHVRVKEKEPTDASSLSIGAIAGIVAALIFGIQIGRAHV